MRSRRRSTVALALALVICLLPATASAYRRPGSTTLASLGLDGSPAKDTSEGEFGESYISADGTHIAFASDVAGLALEDVTPPILGPDIFVRDLTTAATRLASVSGSGEPGAGICFSLTSGIDVESGRGSQNPQLSRNGRYVSFESCATNLVPGDTNLQRDVFVRDLKLGTTQRVSVTTDGKETDRQSLWSSMNANGRTVAFASTATTLGGTGDDARWDVFVHDTKTKQTVRASEGPNGENIPKCSHACWPSIDGTGRYVTLTLDKSEDQGGSFNEDAYLKDLETGKLEVINKNSQGEKVALGGSSPPDGVRQHVTPGGRFVLFTSWASDLVPNDSNKLLDLFVRDRELGHTFRVNVSSSGEEIRYAEGTVTLGDSEGVMDSSGRYFVFSSPANNFADNESQAETDAELYVHDRITGSTRMVSVDISGEDPDCGFSPFLTIPSYPAKKPTVSGDGRYIAFHSCARNLVEGDERPPFTDAWQLYVRDQGIHLGPGALVRDGKLSVQGSPDFRDTGYVEVMDDAPPERLSALDGFGGFDISAAVLAYRELEDDLFVRATVEGMSDLAGVATSSMLYGVSFEFEGVKYEARAQRIPGSDYVDAGGASFGLFRCDGDGIGCIRVASLRGGWGTSGPEITLAIPAEVLGLDRGGALSDIEVFTALGTYTGGSISTLDRLAFK